MEERNLNIDSDLHNDVHPIFHHTNFPNTEYNDYVMLRPALKLASLLIDTECLLDFWFALIFGRNKIVHHGAGQHDWHYAYFRPNSDVSLTVEDITETRDALNQMAHMFSIRRDEENQLGGAKAVCCPEGRLSKIFYCYDLYANIRKSSQEDLETQCRAHFELAVTLTHEIAHAVYFNTSRAHDDIIPFEDGKVGETGLEWTAHVFGGVPDGSSILYEWPSARIVKHYKAHKNNIMIYYEPSEHSVEWTIPISYIKRLFSADFWTSTVSREGATALKVPRGEGWQRRVDAQGNVTHSVHLPPPCSTEAETRSSLSPAATDRASDPRAMSMICSDCGIKFGDMAGAQIHAETSCQSDNLECRAELASLSAEERRQKLESIRAKLTEKRNRREQRKTRTHRGEAR